MAVDRHVPISWWAVSELVMDFRRNVQSVFHRIDQQVRVSRGNEGEGKGCERDWTEWSEKLDEQYWC